MLRFHHVIIFGLILLGVPAGKVLPIDNLPWQKIELGAVVLGSLGIFSLIGEAQRIVPIRKLVYLRPKTTSWLLTLRSVCNSYVALIEGRLERHAEKQSVQPHLGEYKAVLLIFQKGTEFFEEAEQGELPNLTHWADEFPQNSQEKEIKLLRDHVLPIVARYNESLEEYKTVEAQTECSEWETFSVFVAPYFVAASIGLTIFKILYAPT